MKINSFFMLLSVIISITFGGNVCGQESNEWVLAVKIHDIDKADVDKILKEVKSKWFEGKKYQEVAYKEFAENLAKYEEKKVFVFSASRAYEQYAMSLRTVKVGVRKNMFVQIPLEAGPSFVSSQNRDVDSIIKELRSMEVDSTLTISLSGPRLSFLYKQFVCSIVVANKKQQAAGASEVVFEFPANVEYIFSNPPGIFYPDRKGVSSIMSWNLEDIAPGKEEKIEVTLRGVKCGRYESIVKLISNTNKWETKQKTAQSNILGVPAIHISTTDTQDPCEVGKQTTFVITIRNEDTFPCTNVQLKNTISEQMAFVSANIEPLAVKEKTIVFPVMKKLEPAEKIIYKITKLDFI